jgi:hypothetical protein
MVCWVGCEVLISPLVIRLPYVQHKFALNGVMYSMCKGKKKKKKKSLLTIQLAAPFIYTLLTKKEKRKRNISSTRDIKMTRSVARFPYDPSRV